MHAGLGARADNAVGGNEIVEIGLRVEWTALESFLPETQDGEYRRSALASSFVATLELARLGKVEIDQEACFSTLYVRAA